MCEKEATILQSFKYTADITPEPPAQSNPSTSQKTQLDLVSLVTGMVSLEFEELSYIDSSGKIKRIPGRINEPREARQISSTTLFSARLFHLLIWYYDAVSRADQGTIHNSSPGRSLAIEE